VRDLMPLIAGLVSYRLALLAANVAQGAYVVAMTTFAHVVTAARGSTLGLNTALAANPFGAVAAVVGTLTAAFVGLRQSQANARVETDNLIRSLRGLAQARSADYASRKAQTLGTINDLRAEQAALEARRDALVRGAFIDPGRYARGELTKLERDRLTGISGALQNINGQLRVVGLTIVQAQGEIKLADKAWQDAAKAAEAVNAPVAQTASALGGVAEGARSAAASMAEIGKGAEASAAALQGLLDRLFPAQAAARKLKEELALIDGSNLSDDEKTKARIALRTEGAPAPEIKVLSDPDKVFERIKGTSEDIGRELVKLGDRTETQTVRIAETFQDMADRALGALRVLADGIKGGNFLSILEGVIGIGTTLGGLGLFGKKVQANLQKTPGFSNGGTMRLGGMSGIDRNVLSLNGSPIARVTAGETMQIRPANDRGGATVVNNYYTLPSHEFWGRVDGRAAGVVAKAAPAIAGAGAAMAQAQAVQRTQRRVR